MVLKNQNIGQHQFCPSLEGFHLRVEQDPAQICALARSVTQGLWFLSSSLARLHTNCVLARRDILLRPSPCAASPEDKASLHTVPVTDGSFFRQHVRPFLKNQAELRRGTALPSAVLAPVWRETALSSAVLAPVWDAWFRPIVDLFATRFNHGLPTFVSPVPDPAAWAVDALSIPWAGLLAYAFPPLPILSKVLKKAREEQATLILIALKWPAEPWFPDLLCLSHVPPLKLHLHPRALLQPRLGIAHANPGLLDLHAWLLCSTLCFH